MKVVQIRGGIGIALSEDEADGLSQILLRPQTNEQLAETLNTALINTLLAKRKTLITIEQLEC